MRVSAGIPAAERWMSLQWMPQTASPTTLNDMPIARSTRDAETTSPPKRESSTKRSICASPLAATTSAISDTA